MDESTHPNPTSEPNLLPASDRTSAIVDGPADLAKTEKIVALMRRRHSDQSELSRNHLTNGPSVVVYCADQEEVSRGFLIALRSMGVAAVEQPPEPAKPLVARAKP